MEEEGTFGGFDELGFLFLEKARRARIFGLSVLLQCFVSMIDFCCFMVFRSIEEKFDAQMGQPCNDFPRCRWELAYTSRSILKADI